MCVCACVARGKSKLKKKRKDETCSFCFIYKAVKKVGRKEKFQIVCDGNLK